MCEVRCMGQRIVLGFDEGRGTLYFTEAGTRKRASLSLVRGEEALRAMDPGGIEPLPASLEEFTAALRRENHTLKRSLTDPRLFSGIGNAYSDEILHAARLSPLKLTRTLSDEKAEQLLRAVPDGRPAARRPFALEAAEGRLAEVDRRRLSRHSRESGNPASYPRRRLSRHGARAVQAGFPPSRE
jgi:ribosomal protein S13